jgi:hypothetical protein
MIRIEELKVNADLVKTTWATKSSQISRRQKHRYFEKWILTMKLLQPIEYISCHMVNVLKNSPEKQASNNAGSSIS